MSAALLVTSEEYALFASSKENYRLLCFWTKYFQMFFYDFKDNYAESFRDEDGEDNYSYDYFMKLYKKYWWEEFSKTPKQKFIEKIKRTA